MAHRKKKRLGKKAKSTKGVTSRQQSKARAAKTTEARRQSVIPKPVPGQAVGSVKRSAKFEALAKSVGVDFGAAAAKARQTVLQSNVRTGINVSPAGISPPSAPVGGASLQQMASQKQLLSLGRGVEGFDPSAAQPVVGGGQLENVGDKLLGSFLGQGLDIVGDPLGVIVSLPFGGVAGVTGKIVLTAAQRAETIATINFLSRMKQRVAGQFVGKGAKDVAGAARLGGKSVAELKAATDAAIKKSGAEGFGHLGRLVAKLRTKETTRIVTTVDEVTGAVRTLRTTTVNDRSLALLALKIMGIAGSLTFAIGGAYLGYLTLGKWADAEAPESPIILANKFLAPEAQATGDWQYFDAAIETARRVQAISDDNLLFDIFPGIVGPGAKAEGNMEGIDILDAWSQRERVRQVTGGSVEDEYAASRAAKLANEMAITDFRSEVRRRDFEFEQAARADAKAAVRAEDRRVLLETAAFWLEQQKLSDKLEAEERARVAKFWLEYAKVQARAYEDRTPSKLGFGII